MPIVFTSTTFAKKQDLSLTEFAAFNYGFNYPKMRRWEMPYALFQSRLSNMMSVLDCTINPVDFKDRLHSLYPYTHYYHWNPIQEDGFKLPFGMPDGAFDRVICINTLEHLLKEQRQLILAELSRKLRPGGLLIVTCDHYFDSFWEREELLKMGVMRKDRKEVFNGWNKVTLHELVEICKKHNLHLMGDTIKDPPESDSTLYKNDEPYPHACLGSVFYKDALPLLPTKKIILSLLTWNTRDISLDSLNVHLQEAGMLKRLGHEPFIIVCDNGSNDGTKEELIRLDREISIPHKFLLNNRNLGSSIARNQIIELMLKISGDYLLLMDGDIEIVPFSSFAMLRRMEDSGHLLGCLGADSFSFTDDRSLATKYLYSLDSCSFENTNLVAWTQYGLFRRDVFEKGVRFDVNEPFDRVGWGFEDNDLAFQLHMKGYYNQRFYGIRYLHRHHNSSIRVMRSIGIDPNIGYKRRKDYIIKKWKDIKKINTGPLDQIRNINLNF
jgi:GT2 family glycosyltransferase